MFQPLLLKRVGVQFPAPTLGGLQLPVSGDLMPPSGLLEHYTQCAHAHTQTHTCKLFKVIKINLIIDNT